MQNVFPRTSCMHFGVQIEGGNSHSCNLITSADLLRHHPLSSPSPSTSMRHGTKTDGPKQQQKIYEHPNRVDVFRLSFEYLISMRGKASTFTRFTSFAVTMGRRRHGSRSEEEEDRDDSLFVELAGPPYLRVCFVSTLLLPILSFGSKRKNRQLFNKLSTFSCLVCFNVVESLLSLCREYIMRSLPLSFLNFFPMASFLLLTYNFCHSAQGAFKSI